MSRFLQAINPEVIESVSRRIRKAGWQAFVIDEATEDGCQISFNEEGSKRIWRAAQLYRAGQKLAADSRQVFDEAAKAAAIASVLQTIEAELSPPDFTDDERIALREIVLVSIVHGIADGTQTVAEIVLPPVAGN